MTTPRLMLTFFGMNADTVLKIVENHNLSENLENILEIKHKNLKSLLYSLENIYGDESWYKKSEILKLYCERSLFASSDIYIILFRATSNDVLQIKRYLRNQYECKFMTHQIHSPDSPSEASLVLSRLLTEETNGGGWESR